MHTTTRALITSIISRVLRLGLLALLVLAPVANAAPSVQTVNGPSEFKAGTAQVDITPSNNGFDRMFLAGFSGRSAAKPAVGALPGEPVLSARALAIQDGSSVDNLKVIVTADILGFTHELRQAILADVLQRYGLPERNLLLSATHTHNGPMLTNNLDPKVTYDGFSSDGLAGSDDLLIVDSYTNWLEDQIVEVIGQAIARLSTAPQVTLSYGVGSADFATNRIGLPENRDTDVPVLTLRSTIDGSMVALVFGYACHPIVTGNTAELYYHPDYPGYARRILEQNNPGAMAFFIQGAAGDINPPSAAGPPFVEDLGSMLATAVQDVLAGNTMHSVAGPIHTAIRNINLPLNIDPQDTNHAQMRAKYAAISAAKPGEAAGRHANQIIAQIDAGTLPATEPWPVAVWHFGTTYSLVLAALGGEVVSGYALTLKQQSVGLLNNNLWVAGYSNEVPGYIPTNQVWSHQPDGFYEAGWRCEDPADPSICDPFISYGWILPSQVFYGWPAPLKRGDSDSGGSAKGVEELVLENTMSMINIQLNIAPTMTFVSRTAPNTAGWNNTNVSVTWSCDDAIWGVLAPTISQTVTSEGASLSATGTCTNNAGITTTMVSRGIKIDKTAPTQHPVVTPNPVLLGGTANVSSGAADALSGIASQSCGTLNTSTVGTKSVTCTATDIAGNTSSATVSYSVVYSWSGFFQPVDNLPTVNSVKAGQAIPVKFSLGSNQGLAIFATGYPISQQIACNSGAPVDDVEQTVTAGNSSLQYDAGTGQYSYVWKTDKSWAGSCRQLVVRLVDGTEHIASFTFK